MNNFTTDETSDMSARGKIQLEDTFQGSLPMRTAHQPKIISWIMKYSGGLIKDETQASVVVLVAFVLAIALSLLVFIRMGDTGAPSTPVPYDDSYLPDGSEEI